MFNCAFANIKIIFPLVKGFFRKLQKSLWSPSKGEKVDFLWVDSYTRIVESLQEETYQFQEEEFFSEALPSRLGTGKPSKLWQHKRG